MEKENNFNGDPYIKIVNLLFGAIVNSKNLLTNDGRVFMVILFKTIGFRKDMDWLNYKQICKFSGIKHKTRISEAIKNLIEKKLVIRKGKYFKVNQNFEEWLTVDKEIIDSIKEVYQCKKLQNSVSQVTEKRNLKLHKSVTPSTDNILTDKIITDNNIYSRDSPGNNLSEIEKIFNLWNLKKIIIHKSLTSKARSAISSKLKEGYTQNEVIQAIENYWMVLIDDKYYFSYRWTLEKFLQKGFEEFKDINIAKNNYIRKVDNEIVKKHFANERIYTEEDRKRINKKFYGEE